MNGQTAAQCEHLGMVLSRIEPPKDAMQWPQQLDNVVRASQPGPAYASGLARWQKIAAKLPGAVHRVVTTRTQLAVGTGNFSPCENGLSLHHTYGVPYLPGSALKGLARRAADEFDMTAAEIQVMFGDAISRGFVNFNDGWLLSTEQATVERDVMTPHAGRYYASAGETLPDDFQDPNPIAFLVVPRETRFLITLDCPDAPDWAEAAMTVLSFGLMKLGLGGMTNSGYGRFNIAAWKDAA